MRILISNDDGYKADGIIQLAKSLGEIAEVIVVAPSENKSAASSSLTIGKPLNSDSKLNKATYPSIIGLEASQLRAKKLCSEALKILSKLPYNTNDLIKLSKFIILRNK